MFWTDWGEDPKIERAWMNGEDRRVIVDTGMGWPNGIAVDKERARLYWNDALTEVNFTHCITLNVQCVVI